MAEEPEDRWKKMLDSGSGSPYYELIGMKVVGLAEGRARLELPISERLFHGGRVVQGGAIASLADAATACALGTLIGPEEIVSTVELKLNYLRPVNKGELTAMANVVHKGKRIAVADVEIRQNDGKLAAKGMATMMIVQKND